MLIDQFYLQMYSLREMAKEDFLGTLKAVREIGYTGVEFAGYQGMGAGALKKEMDSLGLETLAAHIGIDALRENLEKEIEDLKTLGGKYVVCPWASIKSKDEALEYAEILNKIGEKCVDSGLEFLYHNHAHEFKKDGDVYPYDVFMSNTDPKFVKAEIDVYWVSNAGLDVFEVIEQYKNRSPLIHLKQIGEEKANVCLPDGFLDMAKIIKSAQASGGEYFILEQEGYPVPPLESVKIGFDHIMSL